MGFLVCLPGKTHLDCVCSWVSECYDDRLAEVVLLVL